MGRCRGHVLASEKVVADAQNFTWLFISHVPVARRLTRVHRSACRLVICVETQGDASDPAEAVSLVVIPRHRKVEPEASVEHFNGIYFPTPRLHRKQPCPACAARRFSRSGLVLCILRKFASSIGLQSNSQSAPERPGPSAQLRSPGFASRSPRERAVCWSTAGCSERAYEMNWMNAKALSNQVVHRYFSATNLILRSCIYFSHDCGGRRYRGTHFCMRTNRPSVWRP